MGFENPITFLLEKLNEVWLAILHPFIILFNAIKTGFEASVNFPAEKLRQLWLAICHMFQHLTNWLHAIMKSVETGFVDAINFPAEKLKEVWFTMVHAWDLFVRWLQKVFEPEIWEDRLNHWLKFVQKLALDDTWYPFLTWFDRVFPPETRAERLRHWIQNASKGEKTWVEKGRIREDQHNGSRFGVLMDEEGTENIVTENGQDEDLTEDAQDEDLTEDTYVDIPATVVHLREEAQKIPFHGGQSTTKEIPKCALDVPEEVMNLRKEVQKIPSHGGQATTKEFHKDTSSKPSPNTKATDIICSNKQGSRSTKNIEKGAQGQSELGRRNDLRPQGHQMKKTAPSRQKSTSRVALSDLSNDPRKSFNPALQGEFKILHRATQSLPQNSAEHVKKHPPDLEKPPGFEHPRGMQPLPASGLNTLFEVEVGLPFVALAVVLGLVIYCCTRWPSSVIGAAGRVKKICCGCWGGGVIAVKMMKAPGLKVVKMIARSGFEADPKGYFRNLRGRP